MRWNSSNTRDRQPEMMRARSSVAGQSAGHSSGRKEASGHSSLAGRREQLP